MPERSTPRHFWLRDKSKNPVACVITNLRHLNGEVLVDFAVSTYNVHDRFDKNVGIVTAFKRLSSGQGTTVTIEPGTAKRTVMESIAADSRLSWSVRNAARLWLRNGPTPPREDQLRDRLTALNNEIMAIEDRLDRLFNKKHKGIEQAFTPAPALVDPLVERAVEAERAPDSAPTEAQALAQADDYPDPDPGDTISEAVAPTNEVSEPNDDEIGDRLLGAIERFGSGQDSTN